MNNIKKAIICKDVDTFDPNQYLANNRLPKAGDVGIFKVIKIGKHTSLQAANGRTTTLFEGDYFLGAFGNRYATVVFRGEVPVAYRDEYHILGKGGVVGVVKQTHKKAEEIGPTTVQFVAFATGETGQVLNTQKKLNSRYPNHGVKRNYKVILSVGSSMDSGKTTTAGFLVRGLKNAGKKVNYIKFTGTVFTKDKDFVEACGADFVIDFSDLGYPSTFLYETDELLDLYSNLLDRAIENKPDYLVVEIADGLLQKETKMLLMNAEFRKQFDSIIYSTGDNLGAIGGLETLRKMALTPFAISGRFTASPMLIDELKGIVNIPVLTLEDLEQETVSKLLKPSHKNKRLAKVG